MQETCYKAQGLDITDVEVAETMASLLTLVLYSSWSNCPSYYSYSR